MALIKGYGVILRKNQIKFNRFYAIGSTGEINTDKNVTYGIRNEEVIKTKKNSNKSEHDVTESNNKFNRLSVQNSKDKPFKAEMKRVKHKTNNIIQEIGLMNSDALVKKTPNIDEHEQTEFECSVTNKINKNFNLTKKKDLPQEGLPIIGSLLSFIVSGSSPKLHLYIDQKHKRLGLIFLETLPFRKTIFLSDPMKIRQVFTLEGKYPSHFLPESWMLYNQIYNRKRGLLFMENEEWLHYRKILNKYLMNTELINEMKSTYSFITDQLINKWRSHDGKIIPNLNTDMYLNSLSFMCATAIGSSFNNYYHKLNAELIQLTEIYQQIFDCTSKLMVMPISLVSYFNLKIWTNFVDCMNTSLDKSENLIKNMIKSSSSDGLIMKLLKEGVSEKIISVLLTDLMIAAGDTTAYTMQWALYLLAQNSKIQETIINDSDYVKGVIKETLRLYPAAPFLTRVIQQPLEINGYMIPAGELIVMSMYTAGRDEKNFQHPNQFLPERWNRQNDLILNKFAHLPFSMGVRSCVGKKLAEYLLQTTLTKILSEYELKTVNNVDMVLRMIPTPSENIQIQIKSRHVKYDQ